MNATASKPEEQQEPVTLYGLAAKFVAKAKGDPDKAAAKLTSELMSNLPLTTELVKNAIEVAAKSYAQVMIGNRRAAIALAVEARIENGELPPSGRASTGMTKQQAMNHAAVMATCLMDWPLVDGKKIRDATVADLDYSAARYEQNAQTQALRARLLRKIQAKLPEGKKVAQVLTETDLQALYEEAKNVR